MLTTTKIGRYTDFDDFDGYRNAVRMAALRRPDVCSVVLPTAAGDAIVETVAGARLSLHDIVVIDGLVSIWSDAIPAEAVGVLGWAGEAETVRDELRPMIASLTRAIDHVEEQLRETRARLRVSPDDDSLLGVAERLGYRAALAQRERRRLADVYLSDEARLAEIAVVLSRLSAAEHAAAAELRDRETIVSRSRTVVRGLGAAPPSRGACAADN